MTLQTRILLLVGLLLGFMLALAAIGSRWLASELSAELDDVALGVGQSVLEVIDEAEPTPGAGGEEVLVERIVETDDGTVIRAGHRQVDGRITRMAVQVNQQPAQLLEFPPWTDMNRLETLHVESLTRTIEGPNGLGLRVVGPTVDRQIPISAAGVTEAVRSHTQRLLAGLAGLLVLGALGAWWIATRVGRPLRLLSEAAQEVGEGRRGVQVNPLSAVSEVNQTIAAFNRMSQDLEELTTARDRLAARDHLSELGEIGRGLAHSLRNPLNGIGLTVDRLASTRVSETEAARLAADARAQIQRIDRSIRAFLTLASASQAVAEEVDVRGVVRDVTLELLQGHHAAQIDMAAPEPLPLTGVATEIRAMVHALLVNAVEASEGEAVTVSLSGNADAVEITIEDRGSGIAEQVADRLFLPHTTTKADGSGMGLFLTRRLAETHYQGHVTLEPRAGAGTRATLLLRPREVAHDA